MPSTRSSETIGRLALPMKVPSACLIQSFSFRRNSSRISPTMAPSRLSSVMKPTGRLPF
jgi:hypothetical protein